MESKALTVVRPDAIVQEFAVADVQMMAKAAAASGLFGAIKTPEAAFTLMLLAQAEGLHPIQALRRFDIIEGKPAMKADAMLAEFQARGGRVLWKRNDAEGCEGVFTAPGSEGPVPVSWTIADAQRAGLAGKQNWTKYPRQMLRARCISEGIRMTMPGVIVGLYTPEEVSDFDDRRPARATAVAPAPAPANEPASAEQPAAPPERERPWLKRLQAAVGKLNLGAAAAHEKGLKGKEREDCLRNHRLLYIAWVIGREDFATTLDLTDDEATMVITRAEAGEVP